MSKHIRIFRISLPIIMVLMLMSLITDSNIRASAQGLQVGYVDIQKVVGESDAWKKTLEDMQREYKTKEEIIKKREANLKGIEGELNKQRLVMDEEVKRRKEEEYRREQRDLKRDVEDWNQELAEKQRESERKMLSEIYDVIQNVGRDNGYTIIFHKIDKIGGAILYASDEIDLTQEVIRRYNSKKKP
ncbi:MAG: OmpH family outer membrane protein [Nitrospinota bacterium]